MGQSLKLALFTMLIATPIGVGLALGLARWRGRGSGAGNFLMLFPLVTPELVMGSALFIVFTTLLTFVDLGTQAQLLGHVTFSISYVVIVVRGRLFAIGKEFEEAAMDLGASPVQALRLILLPMLAPAVFAALMIVFAISIDDFVISAVPQRRGGLRNRSGADLLEREGRTDSGPERAGDGHAGVLDARHRYGPILFHRRFAAGSAGGESSRKRLRPPRDLSSIPAEWSGDDHIDHLTTTRRSTVQLRTRSASRGRHTLTGAPD